MTASVAGLVGSAEARFVEFCESQGLGLPPAVPQGEAIRCDDGFNMFQSWRVRWFAMFGDDDGPSVALFGVHDSDGRATKYWVRGVGCGRLDREKRPWIRGLFRENLAARGASQLRRTRYEQWGLTEGENQFFVF